MFNPVLALLATIVLWSSGYISLKIALPYYHPGSIALMHYLVTSIFIIPFIFKKYRSRMPLKNAIICMLIGMIGFGIGNVAMNYGAKTIDPGIVSFVNSQIPITVLIITIFLLKESITLPIILGISISCSGICFIAYGLSHQAYWQIGMIYLIISNICAAIYNVSCGSFLRKYHPIEITAYTTWGGMLFLLFYSPSLLAEAKNAAYSATIAIIYLGIFPGLLGYLCWNYALQHYQTIKACLYLYSIPFVVTLLGWLILKETPPLITFMGGFIALCGSLIHELNRKNIAQ